VSADHWRPAQERELKWLSRGPMDRPSQRRPRRRPGREYHDALARKLLDGLAPDLDGRVPIHGIADGLREGCAVNR